MHRRKALASEHRHQEPGEGDRWKKDLVRWDVDNVVISLKREWDPDTRVVFNLCAEFFIFNTIVLFLHPFSSA